MVFASPQVEERLHDSHRDRASWVWCTPRHVRQSGLCIPCWAGAAQGRRPIKIDKGHIEQFIRTKVEQERLGDAQIAQLLHVGTSTASHWRNKFHIKPADKFERKFQEKYGPDALECFDMMICHGGSLQEVATYFGFTREYARQVYNKLYHGSYSAQQGQLQPGRVGLSHPAHPARADAGRRGHHVRHKGRASRAV